MAQTKEGAIKIAAKKIGIDVVNYKRNINSGVFWCTGCREWHHKSEFNKDKSRWNGYAQYCRDYINRTTRERYKSIPQEKRKKLGPPADKERPGDKSQARHRVNCLVRTGKIPKPNDIPCSDCGHVHARGERRHEYDHHQGYATGKHTVVIPLCSKCHHERHPGK